MPAVNVRSEPTAGVRARTVTAPSGRRGLGLALILTAVFMVVLDSKVRD